MASYLFAWELGAGLGHITVLAPLARALAQRGHRVAVALRDLSAAELVLGDAGLTLLPAPFKLGPGARAIRRAHTFAHILHNCGFDDAGELRGLTRAWQALFDLVRPDVLVADHAPTALLAAWGRPMRTAPMGISFGIPCGDLPLPDWRPATPAAPERLQQDEARVLAVANAALAAGGQPRLERLTDLYAQSSARLVGTIPELDAFGPRPLGEYSGVWEAGLGEPPRWPRAGRKRLFAYLKASPRIKPLLQLLASGQVATLVYMRGDLQPWAAFANERLRFVERPLDMAAVARECDGAICHATHGIASAMLLAGVPQMLFPLMLEQRLTAERIAAAGAGLAARLDAPPAIARRLDAVLRDPRYRDAARQIAERRRDLTGPDCLARAVDRLEGLGRARAGAADDAAEGTPGCRG